MNPIKVLLFISRESAIYSFTRRQIEDACVKAWGTRSDATIQVVDIEDNPDMAEEYNIEALPTLIIGAKRFIGIPTHEMLATCLQIAEPAKGAAAS